MGVAYGTAALSAHGADDRDFSLSQTRIEQMPDRSEEAYRRHYAQLFRYIRRRTPNDFEAEDIRLSLLPFHSGRAKEAVNPTGAEAQTLPALHRRKA